MEQPCDMEDGVPNVLRNSSSVRGAQVSAVGTACSECKGRTTSQAEQAAFPTNA